MFKLLNVLQYFRQGQIWDQSWMVENSMTNASEDWMQHKRPEEHDDKHVLG